MRNQFGMPTIDRMLVIKGASEPFKQFLRGREEVLGIVYTDENLVSFVDEENDREWVFRRSVNMNHHVLEHLPEQSMDSLSPLRRFFWTFEPTLETKWSPMGFDPDIRFLDGDEGD
jgi:hypothetical protein